MTAQIINFADYRNTDELVSVTMQPVQTTDKNQGEAETIPVAKFEVGKTYTCRSACDYDTVFEYTVIARTAKRITIEDEHGKVSKRGVSIWNNAESCKPEGTYSAVITAE